MRSTPAAGSRGRRPLPRLVIGAAVVTLLSCGEVSSDDGLLGHDEGGNPAGALFADARCEEPVSYEACGGELEGTWYVDYACPERRVHVDRLYRGATEFACWLRADSSSAVEGTVRYVDGFESTDLAIRTRTAFTIPSSCIAALEPDLSPEVFCERFEDRLPAEGRVGGCDFGNAGCVCDYRTSRLVRQTVPFQRYLDVLVEFGHDDSAGFSYCVDGDRMVQARDGQFLHLVR